MITLPYQSHVCKVHLTDGLLREASKLNIEYPFPQLSTGMRRTIKNALMVTPNPNYDGLQGFTQFFQLQTKESPLLLDARQFMRWNDRDATYRLVGENDFRLQVIRVALTGALIEKGSTPFDNMGNLPIRVFAKWIGNALTQRLGLDIATNIRIQMIVGLYYSLLLMEGPRRLEKDDIVDHGRYVSGALGFGFTETMEVIEPIESLESLDELCAALRERSGSVRLTDLKFIDLFTIIASSWVGVNARENIGVALEHIPTFIAILYMALTDRSYRRTRMTDLIERTGNRRDRDDFQRKVELLVDSQYI